MVSGSESQCCTQTESTMILSYPIQQISVLDMTSYHPTIHDNHDTISQQKNYFNETLQRTSFSAILNEKRSISQASLITERTAVILTL